MNLQFPPMRILLMILITFAALHSCREKESGGPMKVMDFGAFTIVTPREWKEIDVRGVDSYVGGIAIDESDTLHFDLGWYSNDLSEYEDADSANGNTDAGGSNDINYSPTIIDRSNKNSPAKSAVSWDTIDGRQAKLLSPIKPGTGTTGIYFDSLWQAGSDVDKFNLYGINLKPESNKAVLTALRTVKFRKGK